MPITDADGFENYGDKAQMLQGRWTQLDIATSLRTGAAATGNKYFEIRELGFARRNIGGIFSRVGLGFHFKPLGLPKTSVHTQLLCRFHPEEGAGALRDPPSHFGIKLSPSGRLMLMSSTANSTTLAIGNTPVPVGAWSHLEVLVGAVDGQVDVYLNNVLEVSVSGRTWAPISQFSFGITDTGTTHIGSTIQYDDIVMQGGKDEGDIEQLGILGAYYQWPRADLQPQDWALTTGQNAYALINEPSPDDDVNYIFTPDVGAEAAFEVDPLPSNIDRVVAVIPVARARKSDIGDARLALGVMVGNDKHYGATNALVPNYIYQHTIFRENPATAEPWTAESIPAIIAKRIV